MWFYHKVLRPEDADGMANSVDRYRYPLSGEPDLGLHCLPRLVFLKTLDHYSILKSNDSEYISNTYIFQ